MFSLKPAIATAAMNTPTVSLDLPAYLYVFWALKWSNI